MITRLKSRPMVGIFWLWTLFTITLWSVSLWDGSMHKLMRAAVDIAEADLGTTTEPSTMATAFIWLSFAYFVVTTAVGALLVHLATAGRRWANIVLIPCGLWWAYESVSFPFITNDMYPGMIDWSYWLSAMLGGVVWGTILFLNIKKLRMAAL